MAVKTMKEINIGNHLHNSSEDDSLENISNRLEEVQSMVKPKAEFSTLLKDLPSEQKDRILKLAYTNADVFKRDRRKDWKPQDRLLSAIRTVFLMTCACVSSRRYFNSADPEAGPAVMRKQRKLHAEGSRGKGVGKYSLSSEMQLALTTPPEYRTHQHLKRVQWLLRTTKAFQHLFPEELEKDVAMVVGYERYDDNRHIAYQGRAPERFYYVLAGRVQQLKEYKLSLGCIIKPMGFMNKNATSDPEELEHQWLREYHLVAKGTVEVLTVHRDDFIRLQHTVQGPPIDFLWSIELFKEFPCDLFLENPDAIDFKYYGQNRVVAKDINKTPWLYVVKSGFVKVVRAQRVIDVQNENKFALQPTEELGCGRSFSHAQAMLDLLAKQRRMKTDTDIVLPELLRRRGADGGGRKGVRRKSRSMQEKHINSEFAGSVPVITVEEHHDHDNNLVTSPSPSPSLKAGSTSVLPPISLSFHEPTISKTNSYSLGNKTHVVRSVPVGGSRRGSTNILVPRGTFLTRERTEAGGSGAGASPLLLPSGVALGKKPKKEPIMRRAYLQLDLLRPGDVFGLEDIAEKFRYREDDEEEGLEHFDSPTNPDHQGPPISLVSDGAELIKINKRFFMQHAQNNTMLRVETMQRSYLSTEEAKTILYDKETWSQYKNILMQRLIASLSR